MRKITASKERMEGIQPVEAAIYDLRLDGFAPKFSKNRDSINLNPILTIINHQNHNDQKVFNNLNTKADWVLKDFCHCFGLPMEPDGSGDFTLPGGFDGPDNDPTKWTYVGPLVGRVGKANVALTDAQDKAGNKTGQKRNEIQQFLCSVPGCSEKHSTNLIKA